MCIVHHRKWVGLTYKAMGVCVSQQKALEPGEVLAADQVPATKDFNDFTRPEIPGDPPANYHPDPPLTEQERNCRKVVRNIKPVLGRDPSRNLIKCWEEEGTLSAIQSSVLSISTLHLSSIKDLVHALTHDSNKYLQGISGQSSIILAKAYAIYFWIINNLQPDAKSWSKIPTGWSHSKNQGKGSSCDYASLFNALCGEGGLNSKKIDGHLRGWRSSTGQEFCPNEDNCHSWNVVMTESRPILVDCTLGSKFRNLNCYFDPLPEHLILTHWPIDPSKQYLRPPLLLNNLQPVVPFPVSMHCLGVQPSNWSEEITVSNASPDPVASVSFSLAVGATNYYVTAELVPHLNSSEVARCQDELQQNTYIMKTDLNKFNVQAVLPAPGKFFLNIYLNEIQGNQSKKPCLSYLIESEAHQNDRVGYPQTYPLVARAFNCTLRYWNTGDKAYNCVNSSGGEVSLVFEASPGVSFNHCLVRGRTTGCDEAVYHYQTALVNNGNLYKLLAIFPDEGWWTIHISGTTTFDSVTSGFTSLITYHVYAETGSRVVSYPHVPVPGTVIFPSNPITALQSDVTKVPFATSTPLEFYHYLTPEQPGTGIIEGYSNIKLDKEHCNNNYAYYVLNVIFPKPGTWTVHVYSLRNGVNEGLFRLKVVTVDNPAPNTRLLNGNPSLLEEFDICLMNNGIVTFPDDGQPFSFEFMAPSDANFLHELKSPDNSKVDYSTHLFHQHDAMQQSATYTLSTVFPSPGKWTLELFASKAGENSFNLVVNLKLDVKNPVPNSCYPQIYPTFAHYGCQMSNDSALVKSPCNSSELKLPFQAPSKVYFSFRLEKETCGDFSKQVFVHASPENQDKTLHLIFPECGIWKLIVYASRLEQATEHAEAIMQVCVESKACNHDVSFPLLYQHFYEPFRLFFDRKDLPLPSVVQIGALPQTLHISYYSPAPEVIFQHYAELVQDGSVAAEHVLTRMVSNNDTGLHHLQVEVAQTGHWTIFLFAANTYEPDKWLPVMKHAVRANGNP